MQTMIHQWTVGDRVLLVKCVQKGGRSHKGFQWPKSGVVRPEYSSREPTCESGGLFGWPWGLNLGGGKDPDYHGDWIVFAAKPENVIDLGDKAKVVDEAEVVYYGDWAGALAYTQEGRLAWIQQRAQASDKDDYEAANATENYGAASVTGHYGTASATGYRGAASATGQQSCASATGDYGAASATGNKSIAALTGELGTIEVGPNSLGAVTANVWYWRLRKGAVVICRWLEKGVWKDKVLRTNRLGKDGDVIQICNGKKVNRVC